MVNLSRIQYHSYFSSLAPAMREYFQKVVEIPLWRLEDFIIESCAGILKRPNYDKWLEAVQVMAEDQRVRGYCAYDWGKSAFETSVTTAVFLRGSHTYSQKQMEFQQNSRSEWTADAMFSAAVMVGALLVRMRTSPVYRRQTNDQNWWLRTLTWVGYFLVSY